MRVFLAAAACALGLGLSGCAVAEAGADVVSTGVSAASTAVDVGGDIVSAPLGGESDSDKKDR